MPALHHLRVKLNHLRVKLNKGDLGDGAFLSSLQLCSQLTALHLERISVSESTAMAAAAALARLPNLRELSLKTDGYSTVGPSALVQHLTALTSLRMHKASPDGSSAPMYAAAARNPGLLSFSVSKLEELNAPAAQVQQLLEACPSLTHLNLQNTCIQQDTVDVLLAHGTSITSLSAYRIQPSTSIADRQVSWRKLVLTDEDHPTVQHLANLPLQSLTSLQLSVDPDVRLGLLELPTSSVPAADLPGLLLQATTNLAKCPAWRSKPDPWLMLRDDSVDEPPADASFTPEQRLQLFQALAPLGGPHVRIFALYIEGFDMELGRAEVAALGQSFGKGLEELQLSHVTLAAGFWAALDNALPSLKGLVLEEEVTCSAADIGIYCGRRTTASRFVVLMSPSIYKRCGGQQLRKGLQAQGLSHISVHKYEQ
jgi:Leucine-rich repeat (LRR) protein